MERVGRMDSASSQSRRRGIVRRAAVGVVSVVILLLAPGTATAAGAATAAGPATAHGSTIGSGHVTTNGIIDPINE
jgi:hypothetical protein